MRKTFIVNLDEIRASISPLGDVLAKLVNTFMYLLYSIYAVYVFIILTTPSDTARSLPRSILQLLTKLTFHDFYPPSYERHTTRYASISP